MFSAITLYMKDLLVSVDKSKKKNTTKALASFYLHITNDMVKKAS